MIRALHHALSCPIAARSLRKKRREPCIVHPCNPGTSEGDASGAMDYETLVEKFLLLRIQTHTSYDAVVLCDDLPLVRLNESCDGLVWFLA